MSDYILDDRDSITRKGKGFLLASVQTIFEAHPASYPSSTGGLSLGVKGG
jgi:hypothetical protein